MAVEKEEPMDLRGLCPLLQVYDMPESIEFYCGMKQLYLRDPDGYCLCFQWKV